MDGFAAAFEHFPLTALFFLCACGSKTTCDPALSVDEKECALVLQMQLPESLPASPGNKFADDDNAAMFGFALFFDSSLGSGTGCASCHTPEAAFTDAKPVAVAKGTGTRNTPTTFDPARLQHFFFWDGRADSLWSQPLFAVENPLEMGSSRLQLAQQIAADSVLAQDYENVFDTLPDLSALPPQGMPGDPAWDNLSAAQQDSVNRVAANFGKALEAYERKNTSGNAPLDRYLAGDRSAINDVAKQGLTAFVRDGCVSCHAGSSFSDEKFHAGTFTGAPNDDAGRQQGAAILAANVFNLAGPYSDASGAVVDTSDKTFGAFRTPPLRNVGLTQPYGHAGAYATLEDVLQVHASAPSEDIAALVAFLLSLDGDYPPPPWSNWPQNG